MSERGRGIGEEFTETEAQTEALNKALSDSLDEDSQDTLGKRVDRGNESMRASWGREPNEDERESAAADTISNVLTALFGPAGAYGETDEAWTLRTNEFALNEARRVIEEAFTSYQGDAEDYEVES